MDSFCVAIPSYMCGIFFFNNYKCIRFLESYNLTLHGLAQIVSSPLFVNDRLVDLAGGEVVVFGETDVQEALVVPQIQVHLSSIVQHKHFT